MSEPELYLSDGSKADLFDVMNWWRTTYPSDVFMSKPFYIVEIRKLMDRLASRIQEAQTAVCREKLLFEIERNG